MKTMSFMKSVMVSFFLLCGISMNAQTASYYNTKHEVAFSVGAGTNSQLINDIADFSTAFSEIIVSSLLTGGQIVGSTSYENESYLPAFSAEYFYHVNKVIGIGGIVAFTGQKSDMYGTIQYSSSNKTEKGKIGEAKRTCFSILPAVKFDWLRKKNVGLYSKVAIGASFMNEKQTLEADGKSGEVDKDNEVIVNFQASLIGCEVGSEKVRGFAELGWGEQGFASAGLRFKF